MKYTRRKPARKVRKHTRKVRKHTRKVRKHTRKVRKQVRKQRKSRKQRGSGFMNTMKGLFQKKAKVSPYTSSNFVAPPMPSNTFATSPKSPITKAILTVSLEPVDKTNNNGNNYNNSSSGYPTPEEVQEWFEENGFPVIEFYEYTNPEIQHVGNYTYKVTFTPVPNESEEDIKFNAEMIADADDDGNYPIEKGRKVYLVFGALKDIQFEYK